VIHFLWVEFVPCVKVLRRMSVQYRESVLSQWFVYEWTEKFKNGHTSISHEEGASPSTSITNANVEQVCDMILQNRWVNIKCIQEE
jgi:hypothetical protein